MSFTRRRWDEPGIVNFYGVRVQLPATSDGIGLEFCVLPGACSDVQGLAEPALDLPTGAGLFDDAGYNVYEREEYLKEIEALQLQVPR